MTYVKLLDKLLIDADPLCRKTWDRYSNAFKLHAWTVQCIHLVTHCGMQSLKHPDAFATVGSSFSAQ